MINSAIDRYHALIDQAKLTPADFQGFTERMRDARIMYGDRVQVEYMRAQFLSPEQNALIKHAAQTIWSAMDKLSAHFFSDPRFVEELALTDRERELAAIDPGYPGFSTMARFDSFLIGDHLQFVELNAECPAGPAYTEIMAEAFLQDPVMQAFGKEYEIQGFKTRDRLLDTLLETYEIWAKGKGLQTKPGRIAIVDWDGLSTRHEFEMCKAFFESKGIPTVIEDPRRLRFEGGKLLAADGSPIDLVYRRVLTHEFIGKWDEVQAMVEAYRAGAVCVVNSFRSKFLHKKMIFGLLTDGANQHLFTPEEREVISRHIPWTRKVRPGKTDYHGKEIDLLDYLRANRDQLVMKPNDDYGGRGIYIGWESSAEEWEEAIAKAVEHAYVVQEKVRVASALFPTVREQVVYEQMNVDLDPFVWKGEVEGFLTRLSGTALCNVTSGGGIVPTFVIEPRA
ncbi:Glutathionylspermidine synthase [compost metagenome]